MSNDLIDIDDIKHLDRTLYNIILLKSDNIKIFLRLYKFWCKIDNIDKKAQIKKYIVNYGYMLFCKLSYKSLHTFSELNIQHILELLDFVYLNGSSRIKNNIFRVFEEGLLKINEQYWNWDVIKQIIHYKPLLDWFLIMDASNTIEFEKSKLLGRILSMEKMNGEKSENLELTRTVQAEMREHIFYIFSYIYQNNSEQLYNIFKSVAIFNLPKAQITTHTYYSDFLNTYHFIETCLSILFYINKEFVKNDDKIDNKYIYNQNCAIYKLNNITVLGENVPSDSTEFNTKTKWHFLIYGYYRILFYSLITQNYNCIIQNAVTLSNSTQLILKKYVELNNVYIFEPYNLNEITKFMHYFIDNLDYKLATEDIIYEILQFYSYIMEYNKEFTIANIDLIPMFFLKKIIMDHTIFKNPYVRLRSTKLIFLYEFNYGKLDLGENFLNSLVELSIHIHNLAGMDQYSERIFHQSNIIKIFLEKSFVTSNKELFSVLFTEFDNVLSNKMQDLRNLILNFNNLEINMLNVYHKSLDIYLSHIKNFISYIELCFWSNNGPFTDENIDITYHFCKFMYCIFKNMFDKNSSIIKINYNMSNINMNFWSLFKKYILHLFVYQFNAIFKLPNVVETLHTFYPDIKEFIGLFDIEFDTKYLDDYNNSILLLQTPNFPNDLPSEYLDPILFTPIIHPMILPESGIIIDRTVIMSHLLENKYDPFNRQPITFEQLEEYNSSDNVKEKCAEFICKRNTWIKEANNKIQEN
jgi:hypothetical protein